MAIAVLIRASVVLMLWCAVQISCASNWIPVENSENVTLFWDRDSAVVDRKKGTMHLWSRQILPHSTLRVDGAFFYQETLDYVNVSCQKRAIAFLERLYLDKTKKVIKRVWHEESEFGIVQPDSASMDLLRSVCQFFDPKNQTPNMPTSATAEQNQPSPVVKKEDTKNSTEKNTQEPTVPQGQKTEGAGDGQNRDESLEQLAGKPASTDNLVRFVSSNVWNLFSEFAAGYWKNFRNWVMQADTNRVHSMIRSAYHRADWSYRGAFGPQQWSRLKIEYKLCSVGTEQSPIDVETVVPADLQPLQLHYPATSFSLNKENDRKFELFFHQPGYLQIGTHKFTLKRVEFHQPAEHRIRGYRAPFSIHLYHRDEAGNQAVVAVNVIVGHENVFIRRLLNNLPLTLSILPYEIPVALNPTELLPVSGNYFTYVGSLTYPPCTDKVLWFLLDSPISVSVEQQQILKILIPINARPSQVLNGRIVKFWQND